MLLRHVATLVLAFTLLALPAPAQAITIQGDKFKQGAADWYPYGVHYTPSYLGTVDNRWYESSKYSSSEILQELQFIDSLGFNTISILLWNSILDEPPQIANVNDFFSLVGQTNLKVLVYLNTNVATYNLKNSLAEVDEWFTKLGVLKNNDSIFAFDLGWEIHMGVESACPQEPFTRSMFDGVFGAWVERHYGSVSKFNQTHGVSLPAVSAGAHAAVTTHTIPAAMPLGPAPEDTATVTFKNSGTLSWPATVALEWSIYKPGSDVAERLAWVPHPAPAPTATGASVTFSVPVPFPQTAGRYRFAAQLLNGCSGGWRFGEVLEGEIEVGVQFSSPVSAAATLPATLKGPRDGDLLKELASPSTRAYRRALDSWISRRYARLERKYRSHSPQTLLTVRQGWWGTGTPLIGGVISYPVDFDATAAHVDFLSPEAYEFTYPIHNDQASPSKFTLGQLEPDWVRSGTAMTQAYGRWASAGKPVAWLEGGWALPFGYPTSSATERLARQAQAIESWVSAVRDSGGEGMILWNWAGDADPSAEDFGLTDPLVDQWPPALRPAGTTAANAAAGFTQRASSPPLAPPAFFADPGNRGYADIYDRAEGTWGRQQWTATTPGLLADALVATNAGQRFILSPVSHPSIPPFRYLNGSSVVNGIDVEGFTEDMQADLHQVELKFGANGTWFEIQDGFRYAAPKATTVFARAKATNTGRQAWDENVRFAVHPTLGHPLRGGYLQQLHRQRRTPLRERHPLIRLRHNPGRRGYDPANPIPDGLRSSTRQLLEALDQRSHRARSDHLLMRNLTSAADRGGRGSRTRGRSGLCVQRRDFSVLPLDLGPRAILAPDCRSEQATLLG